MKFHLSIPVSDLDKSVLFFKTFLQTEPTKHYDDYALFISEDPGLELALHLDASVVVDREPHFGVLAGSGEAVKSAAARLEDAGFSVELQPDKTCCYARQTKVWTHDPDGRSWEIYFVHEETALRKGPSPV
ncbi:MAG: ArsI/CadI family heavy metal resistance metalloenzyme [Vulcanimicrobiaceae bacterium]